MEINGQEVEPEDIQIEQREGKPYIETAPLPEYIQVSAELWDSAAEPEDTDSIDSEPGERPWLWLEAIGHADEDVANDGYVLHLDASNVTASYRLVAETEDGNKVLQLAAWAEL